MLFLSIHPEFARAIVDGRKTVELRKRRPSAPIGSGVVIYATTPQCQVVATATLAKIEVASPRLLWKSVSRIASVSKTKFDLYFHESELGVGLHLEKIQVFSEPLSLQELRQAWQEFQPPQQFRYLDIRQQKLIVAQDCRSI